MHVCLILVDIHIPTLSGECSRNAFAGETRDFAVSRICPLLTFFLNYRAGSYIRFAARGLDETLPARAASSAPDLTPPFSNRPLPVAFRNSRKRENVAHSTHGKHGVFVDAARAKRFVLFERGRAFVAGQPSAVTAGFHAEISMESAGDSGLPDPEIEADLEEGGIVGVSRWRNCIFSVKETKTPLGRRCLFTRRKVSAAVAWRGRSRNA